MSEQEPISNLHLAKAFRNAAANTGLAIYSSLMTLGAAIQDASPLFILAPAGGLAAFFTVRAMVNFAKGLEEPIPAPIDGSFMLGNKPEEPGNN
jgi:hypothetical protein